MALPNFLCVGAEKAGTTALYLLLRQHPEVFIPPGKETYFFSRASATPDIRFYEAHHFQRYAGERAIGEFTPDYMRVPDNARRLREALGPIKIIICLREPLRRAFSHYHHCLRVLEESRSFCAACEQDALIAPSCTDHLAIRQSYLRGSLYPWQIRNFIREFGRENLFFVILERDLATNGAKRQLLERLIRFLDLDARPLAGIDLTVRDTSLPCPSVHFIAEGSSPRTVVNPAGRDIIVEPGDIVFTTGNRNLNRVIRRPSVVLQGFFREMAQNMTRSLTAQEEQHFRARFFTGVVDQTSEIIDLDLAALWSSGRIDT